MKLLCVINETLAKKLLGGGGRLMQRRTDMKGQPIWFFEPNGLSFDISNAIKSGDAFFNSSMSIVF